MIKSFDDDILSQLKEGTFKGPVENIPNKIYHSLEKYFSSTQLKYLHQNSPLHFKTKYIDRSMEEKAPSYDMVLGSLVHALFLDPSEFKNEFFEMPELNLRTNAGREEKDRLQIENANKTLVTQEQTTEAYKIAESLRSNKLVSKLKMKTESAYFWKCPFTGMNFRSKIDGLDGDKLIELKTTSSGKPDAFQRHIHNMNYDLQMAHYIEGIRQNGGEINKVIMIAVDTSHPYAVQPYELSEDFINLGHKKWLDSIQQLERGFTDNFWPSYYFSEDEMPIMTPPRWAIKGEENV